MTPADLYAVHSVMDMIESDVPDDSSDWNRYICFAFQECMNLLKSVRNKKLAARVIQALDDTDVPSLKYFSEWRKNAAAVVTLHRFASCCRIIVVPGGQDRVAKRMAVADALVKRMPPKMTTAAIILLERFGVLVPICRDKAESLDDGWMMKAFSLRDLRGFVFNAAVNAGCTDSVVKMIADLGSDHDISAMSCDNSVATMFHTMDSRRIAVAVMESGVRLTWRDAIMNHRARENTRRTDPSTPPLHPSFYDMVLDGTSCVIHSFDRHSEVMTPLDALVEMHNDGRIDKRSLDRARDRLFSIAVSHGSNPSYKYLLDGFETVSYDRLASVVVPLAMAKRRLS